MNPLRLLALLVALVLACGCEYVEEYVDEKAQLAIKSKDPKVCFGLNAESDLNWCLMEYSATLNDTSGCKLITNSTALKDCYLDVAISAKNSSICGDLPDLMDDLKCRAEAITGGILAETTGEENRSNQED